MVSQNFFTNNSLIKSTTNDIINKVGVKNNVLWSDNVYQNKSKRYKSHYKNLNVEKPIIISSCCTSCT